MNAPQMQDARARLQRLDELIERNLSPAQVRVLLRQRQTIYWRLEAAMSETRWSGWTMYCPFDGDDSSLSLHA